MGNSKEKKRTIQRHRHIHHRHIPRDEKQNRDEVPFHWPHVLDFKIERGDILHDLLEVV